MINTSPEAAARHNGVAAQDQRIGVGVSQIATRRSQRGRRDGGGVAEGVGELKGVAHDSRGLYMAALTATRCNPVPRPPCQQLRARGKNHRVAITAVMRKLLVHLNKISHDSKNPLVHQHS